MTSLARALSNSKTSDAECLDSLPNAMRNCTLHGSRREVRVLVINTGGTIGMKSHNDGKYLSMFSDEPGESITFLGNHLMDHILGHLGCSLR